MTSLLFPALSWPGQTAAERAFGAFADALGVQPLREGLDTWQKLVAAQIEECAAIAAYLRVVADACTDASLSRLPARLAAATERGDAAATPFALLGFWAEALDASMHEAMLSERGLEATAATVRAGSRRRLQAQRLAEGLRAALGIPTRGEIDDVHLEVQELKREMRRLERQIVQRKDAA